MAGLRVQQHGVDGERIDLPLPPVAAPPPALIGRAAALEHEAFDTALTRFRAQCVGLVPVRGRHGRRHAQPRIGVAAQQRFQTFTPLGLRQFAQVLAFQFKQVVRQHLHRRLGQPLGAGL